MELIGWETTSVHKDHNELSDNYVCLVVAALMLSDPVKLCPVFLEPELPDPETSAMLGVSSAITAIIVSYWPIQTGEWVCGSMCTGPAHISNAVGRVWRESDRPRRQAAVCLLDQLDVSHLDGVVWFQPAGS